MIKTKEKTARIRELNDAFRKSFEGGRILLTAGVGGLPGDVRAMVMRKVAAFSEFSADNDPYDEHDFGSFGIAGQKLFWKLDYYAPDMLHGSEDPSDPARTVRVLTIMLAEEY